MKTSLSTLALALLLGAGLLTGCQKPASADGAASAQAQSTPATATADAHEGHGHADAAAAQGPLTSISFAHMQHAFGKINQGEKVSHRFTFTNTGKEPLVIADVKPSCGCTAPNWTKEPVAPGASGFIDVEYDSKSASGFQNKTVTVTANTPERIYSLSFSGEVVAK